MDNLGYHIGSLEFPTETIESRNYNFRSNIGYLGTGYYFFSNIEKAKKYSEYAKLEKDEEIYQFDISKYNLYKPTDSNKFYDYIKQGTQTFGLNSVEENQDKLKEFIKTGQDVFGILLKDNVFEEIIIGFNNDVINKKNGSLLSNRLLSPLGFEGINNMDTPLDDIRVGSVLFKLKENAYKNLSQQNEAFSRKWLRRRVKRLFTEEENDNSKYLKLLGELVQYCCQELKINKPKISIINNSTYTEQYKSYGGYSPEENQIFLVIYNRALADSMRSLSHEIYHSYQNNNNLLTLNAGEDGDVFENEANAYAGKTMRKFGREHPEIFFMKYKSS